MSRSAVHVLGAQNLSVDGGHHLGSSNDNPLAESISRLFNTETLRRRGPWLTVDAVEIAIAEWVDSGNHRRID